MRSHSNRSTRDNHGPRKPHPQMERTSLTRLAASGLSVAQATTQHETLNTKHTARLASSVSSGQALSSPPACTHSQELAHVPSRFSPRPFVQTVALAGTSLPLVSTGRLFAADANSKVNLAAVGVGGRGWADLKGITASPNVNVVALCDTDEGPKFMGQAATQFPAARAASPTGGSCSSRKTLMPCKSRPRSHALPSRPGGLAVGQAGLLPEAADPYGPRSPAIDVGRQSALPC